MMELHKEKTIIEIQYFAALRWGEEEEIMMFPFSVTILTQTQTIIFTTSKIDRNWKYIFVRKLTIINYNIYSIFLKIIDLFTEH